MNADPCRTKVGKQLDLVWVEVNHAGARLGRLEGQRSELDREIAQVMSARSRLEQEIAKYEDFLADDPSDDGTPMARLPSVKEIELGEDLLEDGDKGEEIPELPPVLDIEISEDLIKTLRQKVKGHSLTGGTRLFWALEELKELKTNGTRVLFTAHDMCRVVAADSMLERKRVACGLRHKASGKAMGVCAIEFFGKREGQGGPNINIYAV